MPFNKKAAEDSILIAALIQGNEAALAEIRNCYNTLLFLRAIKMLEDRHLAEETVNDVFLHFWEKRKNLPTDIVLEAYLQEAVKNACLNILEKKKNKKNLVFIYPENGLPETAIQSDPIVVKEMNAALEHVVNNLPRAQKRALKLAEEGLTYRQISEKTSTSVNTVRNNIAAARKTVREELINLL